MGDIGNLGAKARAIDAPIYEFTWGNKKYMNMKHLDAAADNALI